MKHKQLSDFPEFVEARDAVQRAQAEFSAVIKRKAEIEMTPKKVHSPDQEWGEFQSGGEAYGCTAEVGLREEFAHLEQRERFLARALEQGRRELGRIRGHASAEICQQVRLQFAEEIRRLLAAIKTVCECNQTLERMRFELESGGIETGAIAHCVFGIGGRWNDETGGKIVDFRRHVAQFYPEVAEQAEIEIERT